MKLILSVGMLAVLGCLVGASLARANPAEQFEECKDDRDRDLAALRRDELAWRKVLDSKQEMVDTAKSGEAVDGHPEFSAICDCRPTFSDCPADFWTAQMGLKPEEIKRLDSDTSRGCLRIYQKYGVNLQSGLPPSCYGAIAGIPGDASHIGCGMVSRLTFVSRLSREIAILQRKLDNDVPARKQRINDDYKDCVHSIDRYSSNINSPGATPGSASGASKVIPSEDAGGAGIGSAAAPAASAAKPQ